ncbi:hypothetical protein ABK040_016359 [Willaertia magna]
MSLNTTKYKWDDNYLTNAQLLNDNKSIKKIVEYGGWKSYKLTPIIKLTNNIQEFKFKIDKESQWTWIGICDLMNEFNHNYLIGYNGNNLEYAFGSHSSSSYISNCNATIEIKRFNNINFTTGDTIIIQLKRGQFILINETRYNQPCICDIPQEMESVHLVLGMHYYKQNYFELN